MNHSNTAQAAVANHRSPTPAMRPKPMMASRQRGAPNVMMLSKPAKRPPTRKTEPSDTRSTQAQGFPVTAKRLRHEIAARVHAADAGTKIAQNEEEAGER